MSWKWRILSRRITSSDLNIYSQSVCYGGRRLYRLEGAGGTWETVALDQMRGGGAQIRVGEGCREVD